MGIPQGEVAPLFLMYANAAFEAQRLENGLAALLNLVSEYEKRKFPKRAVETLSTSAAPKTLRRLLKAVSARQRFTSANKELIKRAAHERNFLVHRYWQDRLRVAASKEGRTWIIEDLTRIRDLVRKAHEVVAARVDGYLRQHDRQPADFDDTFAALWESEMKPPKRLLP